MFSRTLAILMLGALLPAMASASDHHSYHDDKPYRYQSYPPYSDHGQIHDRHSNLIFPLWGRRQLREMNSYERKNLRELQQHIHNMLHRRGIKHKHKRGSYHYE